MNAAKTSTEESAAFSYASNKAMDGCVVTLLDASGKQIPVMGDVTGKGVIYVVFDWNGMTYRHQVINGKNLVHLLRDK